jgi:hypothetical protein
MGIQAAMRIYISGALRGANDLEAARVKYETTARLLSREGISAYLPHQQTDPYRAWALEPVTVFSQDLQALSESDAILAFLDEPSLGVGAEIVLAVQNRKPVVGVYRNGNIISRFIEGFLISANCSILRYDDLEDLVNQIVIDLSVKELGSGERPPPLQCPPPRPLFVFVAAARLGLSSRVASEIKCHPTR